MQPRTSNMHTPVREAAISSPPRPAANEPLSGFERIMADALEAAARNPRIDPGAIEYASWLRLLHRSTPRPEPKRPNPRGAS